WAPCGPGTHPPISMKRVTASLALLVLPLCTVAAEKREVNTIPSPPAGAPLALVGARLIDGRGGEPIVDAVVIVNGARIAAAGARHQVRIPANAVHVDASGLTVLPGLVDSHLHTKAPATASLFLLNGVT